MYHPSLSKPSLNSNSKIAQGLSEEKRNYLTRETSTENIMQPNPCHPLLNKNYSVLKMRKRHGLIVTNQMRTRLGCPSEEKCWRKVFRTSRQLLVSMTAQAQKRPFNGMMARMVKLMLRASSWWGSYCTPYLLTMTYSYMPWTTGPDCTKWVIVTVVHCKYQATGGL